MLCAINEEFLCAKSIKQILDVMRELQSRNSFCFFLR